MARNRYPGYCYCCGVYVPVGYGHFEKTGDLLHRWRIKCVKCASGRVDMIQIRKLYVLVS